MKEFENHIKSAIIQKYVGQTGINGPYVCEHSKKTMLQTIVEEDKIHNCAMPKRKSIFADASLI